MKTEDFSKIKKMLEIVFLVSPLEDMFQAII